MFKSSLNLPYMSMKGSPVSSSQGTTCYLWKDRWDWGTQIFRTPCNCEKIDILRTFWFSRKAIDLTHRRVFSRKDYLSENCCKTSFLHQQGFLHMQGSLIRKRRECKFIPFLKSALNYKSMFLYIFIKSFMTFSTAVTQ